MENRDVYFRWVPLILTALGFVWQSAVLWEKLEANVRQVNELQYRIKETERLAIQDSIKISALESKLSMVIDNKNRER